MPGVVRFQEQTSQRRRQGQGVDRRQNRRDGDGNRELAIEFALQAGQECRRDEDRGKNRCDRDDRRGHLIHRLASRFFRRFTKPDMSFDVLDDHDGIVDHDADRQHQAEQGQGVEREAQQIHHRERADERYRNGDERDDGGAPGLQEQDNDDHHQNDRFDQRLHHRRQGRPHEHGWIISDPVFEALREVALQLLHLGANRA